MTHKVKIPDDCPRAKSPILQKKSLEVQRAPKAESPKGQSALKGIMPNRDKSTEIPTVLKGLNSDKKGKVLQNKFPNKIATKI